MESKKFNWGPGIFLIAYHIFLIIALPLYLIYGTLNLSTIVATFVFLYLTGLSITAGYHRFYAHRAYKTNKLVEVILLFFSSMAGQGSALRWSFDHRNHHAYVDTDKDPYSIKKGFWYAHMLWIFEKPRTIDPKTVPDLMKNKMIMFQHKHFALLMTITNLLVFLVMGWALNDYLGAFMLVVWTRLFLLHHFTWFINSLAHTWGEKPFSEEHSAVDNYIISLLTFGEGYHNYHHTFANDYRNGIRWWHFDPTKWLIWLMNKLGLAHQLKRTDAWVIKKRMVMERKNLILERTKQVFFEKKEILEKEIQELSDNIVNKISTFCKLSEQYENLKNECAAIEILKPLKREIKALKKSLRSDWRYWTSLSKHILKQLPA